MSDVKPPNNDPADQSLIQKGKVLKNRFALVVVQSTKRFRLWTKQSVIPRIHKTTEKAVDKLTFEEGSAEWAALAPSNR